MQKPYVDQTKSPPKPKGQQWQTFENFVKHAKRCYGGESVLSYEEVKQFILKKLKLKRLSPIAVVCYINWCDNGFFTQEEIANKLGIAQRTVADYIKRLRKVWPFLPSHPNARGQRHAHRRSNDFGRMTRLKKKVLYGAKVRVTW